MKKGTLQVWETLEFMTQSSKRCKSLDGKEIRTPILNLQLQQLRIRLDSLLVDIKSTADLEQVTPKTIASLCLQLIANEEKNYKISEVCKEIIENGTYGDPTIWLTKQLVVQSVFEFEHFNRTENELGDNQVSQIPAVREILVSL